MLQTILLLLIVLDPFGNVVLVNGLLRSRPAAERRGIILRESLIALGLLLLAAVLGRPVMNALGLQTYSLGIAGGIVLFMIAMGMIFPARRMMDEEDTEDPVIVPIAVPLIAGPGTVSLVLLLAQQQSIQRLFPAVVAAWVPATVLLLVSPWIHGLLGSRGSRAIERLTGMLLILLSVQMVLDGVRQFVGR
jgi:multiple antibiotic resistance protein